jgi:hypothetical protein
MRIISVKETAQQLGLSPLSLADKRFRARIGLPGVKLGRRLGFDERDIEQLILRGREKMLVERGEEVQPQPNELVGVARENRV